MARDMVRLTKGSSFSEAESPFSVLIILCFQCCRGRRPLPTGTSGNPPLTILLGDFVKSKNDEEYSDAILCIQWCYRILLDEFVKSKEPVDIILCFQCCRGASPYRQVPPVTPLTILLGCFVKSTNDEEYTDAISIFSLFSYCHQGLLGDRREKKMSVSTSSSVYRVTTAVFPTTCSRTNMKAEIRRSQNIMCVRPFVFPTLHKVATKKRIPMVI